ncbi:MAG: cell surface protein SprA [Bacteroidota bacterium]
MRGWFLALIPFLLVFLHEAGNETAAAGSVSWAAFQDTTRAPGRSGPPSRRAMALQRKLGARDTSTAKLDSLLIQSLAATRDSSARLAQFHHVRRDPPTVDPFQKTIHSLYLKLPAQIRTIETLDSSDFIYRIRLMAGNQEIKMPLSYSLEEYRDLRLKRTVRKIWEALSRSYELTAEQKQDLGDVFGSITNIQIPVPKNPLFSIFGKNVINIQINGSVDIHAAFRNTESDLVTSNFLDQSRSEPDFDQQVRVGVRGEIGDKLRIDADWDTERTFEYENQLKVRYTGYEDEIIQNIEAGNVSLQTNSSFISSSQALFGIKAGFQFGPLKLTTIATQKRGQVKELSVSSGQRATPFEKKPYEYSRDHFFIDTVYRSLYDIAFSERPLIVNTDFQIQDIEVWVSRVDISSDPGNDRDGVALIDKDSVIALQNNPAARASEIPADPGRVEIARFMKLIRETDYTLNPNLGILTLNRSLLASQVVAVAYTVQGGDVGNFESKDTSKTLPLILKLVRPKNLQPSMQPAWDLMLKNIYPLGGRDIVQKDFQLDLKYQLSGQEAVTTITVMDKQINLLNLFGLDLYTSAGDQKEDGIFDFDPGITIDQKRGEIIFPSLEPFGDNLRKRLVELLKPTSAELPAVLAAADSFAVDLVYDTTYNGAQNAKSNRLSVAGSIVSGVQSKFNLGFNVAEGSVIVKVNGQVVSPGSDYSVDYLTGTVVIQNPAYLTPGAQVNIEYEANDLFQLASKSLVGARGELSISKSSALGFTIMNLNQQTLSDKVRLGEEPISNTIMGVDGSTSMELDFLTRALNWLPGIRTNIASTLALKGEAAYMLPDPNTRKSTISQDQDAGVAYVDDFEGARKTIPLGTIDRMWRDASVPAYISTIDPYQPPGGFVNLSDPLVRQSLMVDTSKMEFKSKLTWFNIEPSDVLVAEIWPERRTRSAAEDLVTTLNLFLSPSTRGPFNYSLNLQDSLFAQPTKAWAGIMRPLGSIATNLLDENITFVELWMRVEKATPGAKLNINLGTVSEDVIPNRILNTEDGLGGGLKTGTIREGQDLGLDMLTDDEERERFAAFVSAYPEYTGDPSGDNYVIQDRGTLSPAGYVSMHGTEGNAKDRGSFPDTEDLNANNIVDRTDSYFEYEISLDTASADFQKYVTGGQSNTGWYQIRIPIKESTRRIGNPTLSNIESVRLWLTGANNDVYVRLTEFNLVGNQWEAVNKNDDNFRLSSVSIEENPFYRSPPGVKRPVDRTRPDQTIEGNEQSLALQITDLADGESKQAVKKLIGRPLDVFSYKTMKLFVHGDERPGFLMQYIDTTNYYAEFFLRFGSDSLNYYEYRAPIRPGWHPDNWITIRFEDLTALKLGRDSATAPTRSVPVPNGAEGATYRVLGNPALTKITEIVLGVENPAGKGVPFVTGEVWVNELRLSEVDDTPGWAYRTDATIRLADVATVSVAMTRRDPFFHSLENRFGTRIDDQNWTVNSSVTLDKFLPDSWKGSRASLSYSHAEVQQVPRYVPGTDILVEEAAERTGSIAKERGASDEEAARLSDVIRQQSRSLTVTESFSLPSVQLMVPSSSWLVTETINRMTFAYSFSNTRRRDPVTQSHHLWLWNFRVSYGLQFGTQNFLQPFSIAESFFLFSPWKGTRIFFLPRSLNFGTTLARQQAREQARNQALPKPVGRSFESTRQMSFSWPLVEGGFINPSIDYTLDVSSSLVHLEIDELGRQRSFGEMLGDMFGGKKIINFGHDRSYMQSVSLNTRIVVPSVLKFDKIFTPSFRYSSRYDWQNNFQAGVLGKNTGRTVNATGGMDVTIKVIADEIWGTSRSAAARQPIDTTGTGRGVGERLDQMSRILFKTPFFDWDKVTISFSHSNTARNSGVLGTHGFLNMFGRLPFAQESLTGYGPSLMYQLGLSSDPHGDVVVKTKGGFPFVTGYSVPGRRAPNGNLSDIYNQSNNVTIRTQRTLWEGARLDLNWTLTWSHNLNRSIRTNSLGIPTELSRTVSGDVSRSFVTFPNTFVFSMFKTGVEEVSERFEELKRDISDPRPEDVKLTQAFEEGMEAFSLGRTLISRIMPRPNWSFRWDGLERMALFSSFASRVTLDHGYTSSIRRRWRLTPNAGEVTESENVTYGFVPLIGVTITFKGVGKGSLTANARYSTSTATDLSPAVRTITESNTSDITLTGNFTQRGFEFPLFGLSLSNDIDINFSYSYSRNNRRAFDFREAFKKDGEPLEGTIRTIIEPRIRYTLSSRVSASIYYKYTRLKPDEGGSRIPGSTINEGGLDIRVQIS